MRILALEPFYGGSHRTFLDGWIARSRHDFTVLGLPAYKWKWRMRHAAITFASDVAARVEGIARSNSDEPGEPWDALFCSDMLNLAEFLGLAPRAVRDLPRIAYFHENQLTYPVRQNDERDLHFAFSNLTTALAATQAWFNSAYHRDEFLAALETFLARMPDHQPLDAVATIRRKSAVHAPGIDEFPPRGERKPGPLRILWAARWEHDKNPDAFFAAVRLIKSRGAAFRLSVIGEQFEHSPPVFEAARREFAAEIDHWGYQPSREAYLAALREADVVVSTADHEFFGISVVEAIAAGCRPLLPRRLAYPEVLGASETNAMDAYLYEGGPSDLAARLEKLAGKPGDVDPIASADTARLAARFAWPIRAADMDTAFVGACG